jgi:hypothetical protein
LFHKIKKRQKILKIRKWIDENQDRQILHGEKIKMAVDLGISFIELNDFIKNAFRRRKRVKKRNLQNKEMTTKTLKTFFENITEYPSIHEIQILSENLNINKNKVNIWFKNRRFRENKEKKLFKVFSRI